MATKNELIQEALNLGIDVNTEMTKNEIINAINDVVNQKEEVVEQPAIETPTNNLSVSQKRISTHQQLAK